MVTLLPETEIVDDGNTTDSFNRIEQNIAFPNMNITLQSRKTNMLPRVGLIKVMSSA